MNHPKRKNRILLKPLTNGQVWHMAESDLHIKDVGRLLVQYKLFRGNAKKTVTTMSAMRVVENYLTDNKAVLVQE
jgi:hypothetical protein